MNDHKPYDPLQLLTPKETADLLGISEKTLAVWRCTGRQILPYIKVGRKVMYRPEALDSFIDARTMMHVDQPCSDLS